jgi:hypothetical protein
MENLIEHTRAVLQTTLLRWAALIESLPVELLAERPLAGEWSALDCLDHLLDTEREVFSNRVRYFLAGQDFPAFDPDAEGCFRWNDLPLTSIEFTCLRAPAWSCWWAEAEDLPWRPPCRAGMVSLEEMLHEWAAHNLMHTVQAERALMQPFIRGSGPWDIYFTDHIARPTA